MTASPPRPRVVDVAFWCWLGSSVLLLAFGLLLATARADLPLALRGFGVLFAVSGAALGFLAGRSRSGNARFRRAALGLAVALVVLLALFSVATRGAAWLLILILVMVGVVLMLRPTARAWYDETGDVS
jgi:hypothetical protein